MYATLIPDESARIELRKVAIKMCEGKYDESFFPLNQMTYELAQELEALRNGAQSLAPFLKSVKALIKKPTPAAIAVWAGQIIAAFAADPESLNTYPVALNTVWVMGSYASRIQLAMLIL